MNSSDKVTLSNRAFGDGRGWYESAPMHVEELTFERITAEFAKSGASPSDRFATRTAKDINPWLVSIVFFEKEEPK